MTSAIYLLYPVTVMPFPVGSAACGSVVPRQAESSRVGKLWKTLIFEWGESISASCSRVGPNWEGPGARVRAGGAERPMHIYTL